MTRALRSIAIALGTWALVGACAFAIYRGVTQPGARLLGIGNGTAKAIAWWTLFAVLPAVLALDAAHIPQADWWAARSSKVAWVGMIVMLPFVGPLGYVTWIRHRVGDAYSRSLPRLHGCAAR